MNGFITCPYCGHQEHYIEYEIEGDLESMNTVCCESCSKEFKVIAIITYVFRSFVFDPEQGSLQKNKISKI